MREIKENIIEIITFISFFCYLVLLMYLTKDLEIPTDRDEYFGMGLGGLFIICLLTFLTNRILEFIRYIILKLKNY